MKIKNQQLRDIESKGKVSFNTKTLNTHQEAEKFARTNYRSVIERDVFVAGWNMAFWDELERLLKKEGKL